jgi:hypothetical protein
LGKQRPIHPQALLILDRALLALFFGSQEEQIVNNTTEYKDRLVAMLPSGCNDLIKTAARRECRKPSEWVRHAVLRQLENDGYCLIPANNEKVA